MLRFLIILIVFYVSLACNSTQAVSENKKDISVAPIEKIENEIEPKPETVKVPRNFKPNAKQRKLLDADLPPKVRKFLETAETFEILAQIEKKDGKIIYPDEGKEFNPNVKAIVSETKSRKELLAQFYFDIATSEIRSPACYRPHHLIRAKQGEKIVEVEICFSCSRFIVKGSLGKFQGLIGLGAGAIESEQLFKRIIETESIDIQ